MKNRIALALLTVACSAAAGCLGFEHKGSATGPSAVGASSLMGVWSSQNIIPSPSSCTDFKWNATQQTNTSAKGNFSATCAGELKLTGTAEGAFTSTGKIEWSAQGNATAPGLTTCGIALSGTAELTTNSIRIPYSGNTCLGPVSGTEVLQRD